MIPASEHGAFQNLVGTWKKTQGNFHQVLGCCCAVAVSFAHVTKNCDIGPTAELDVPCHEIARVIENFVSNLKYMISTDSGAPPMQLFLMLSPRTSRIYHHPILQIYQISQVQIWCSWARECRYGISTLRGIRAHLFNSKIQVQMLPTDGFEVPKWPNDV